MPRPAFITDADVLVTTRAATRAGFIEMALEKGARAIPILGEARALRARAINLGSPQAVVNDVQIRQALLSAAGLSDKALNYLDNEDRIAALESFKETYLDPAGDDFADEITYRYLLTKGDALGGTMRNLAGRLADKKFLAGTVAALQVKGANIQWRHKGSSEWNPAEDVMEISEFGNALHWMKGNLPRTLLFNVRVPLVSKNVDSVILSCFLNALQAKGAARPQNNPAFYVALGELKGGIDPAGADEHWKTARSSIQRIGAAFAGIGQAPNKYFVGAAIVGSMAGELVNFLDGGSLNFAANLTNDEQLGFFFDWLTEL